MEDAIALATAIEQHADLETALNEYELERKPVVEIFQDAAQVSQAYFETIKRYLGLEPMQFTFQLLTRSGRISYDDLRLRDPRLPAPGTRLCRQFHGQSVSAEVLEKGFRYQERVYRSLSAVAREVTGVQWNGFAFFALSGSAGATS